MNVVGTRAAAGDDLGQLGVGTDWDPRRPALALAGARGALLGVGRQQRERAANQDVGLVVVLGDEVDLAGLARVDVDAAELVVGEVLAGGDLGNQRRGDRQAGAADLDHEIACGADERRAAEGVAGDHGDERDATSAAEELDVDRDLREAGRPERVQDARRPWRRSRRSGARCARRARRAGRGDAKPIGEDEPRLTVMSSPAT